MVSNPKTVTIASISFNNEKLEQFRRAYKKAIEDKVETFTFEGKEIVPAYAKYMIEYLAPKLR